ncbi:hypothetical protein EON65_50075 [archaeon]|nr:MAG: hypothetical protein EON65_50075 [archaeon]
MLSSSPQNLRENLKDARIVLHFLEKLPVWLTKGPWHPITHIVVSSYAAFVINTFQYGIDDYKSFDYIVSPPWLQWYRLAVGLYCAYVSWRIFCVAGLWPFASYTLTSWNIMGARFLTAYLAGCGFHSFALIADFLRFPTLVGGSVTVLIWWFLLVPIIDYVLKPHEVERKAFWHVSFSFSLLNVHLFNLPAMYVEFVASGQKLSFFDLWVGLFVALLYALFYLNVCDPLGLQFYVVYSPRTALCFFSYVLILVGYYTFYRLWNEVI